MRQRRKTVRGPPLAHLFQYMPDRRTGIHSHTLRPRHRLMRFWHSLAYIRDHHSPAWRQVNIHRVMNTLGVMRQLITPYREFSGSVTQHHVAGYPARSRLSGTPQLRNNPD
ncbi:Uncharacterised protein [Shigella sonnei]|nr:Uncharacterised protein [Shigella sonnei]